MNLLFPSYCLHCDSRCTAHLCSNCAEQIALLSSQRAALPNYGPAASLLEALRESYLPFLAKGLAGYLALQLHRIDIPIPDFIIPVPSPIYRRLKRGYSPTSLLARALGNILNVPVRHPLKRRAGDYPQTSLSLEQRRALSSDTFSLKKRNDLHHKTLLLLDDLIVTGRTQSICKKLLNKGGPAKIDCLALCDDDF